MTLYPEGAQVHILHYRQREKQESPLWIYLDGGNLLSLEYHNVLEAR